MKKYSEWEFEDRLKKFTGKSSHECYKLLWQWAKEKTISLSLFEALCEAVATTPIKNKITAIKEQFFIYSPSGKCVAYTGDVAILGKELRQLSMPSQQEEA